VTIAIALLTAAVLVVVYVVALWIDNHSLDQG